MKLGIMQPYFFPYIGYFSLIANTDKWVGFDITQYTPKTWMNRNRILHPNKEKVWQYITVPLSNSSIHIKIYEALIEDKEKAKTRILGQLQHYKKTAPYFKQVLSLVEKTFENTKTSSLVELNVNSIKSVCEYLDISFDYKIASEQNFIFKENMQAGDWALFISEQIGADEYVNPEGGEALFDKNAFEYKGIKLTINSAPDLEYECGDYKFEKALSILDVLMWNDIRKTRNALGVTN